MPVRFSPAGVAVYIHAVPLPNISIHCIAEQNEDLSSSSEWGSYARTPANAFNAEPRIIKPGERWFVALVNRIKEAARLNIRPASCLGVPECFKTHIIASSRMLVCM